MTKEEARYLLDALEGDKGRKFGGQALKLMWPTFESASMAAGEKAFDYLILNNTMLPTANAVIAQIQHAQRDIDMAAAKVREGEERETRRHTPTLNEVKPSSKLGQDAILGLKMIIHGAEDNDMREFFLAMGQRHGDRWYKVGDDIMEQRRTGKAFAIM